MEATKKVYIKFYTRSKHSREEFVDFVSEDLVREIIFPTQVLWDVPEGLRIDEDVDDYDAFIEKHVKVLNSPEEINFKRMGDDHSDSLSLYGPLDSYMKVDLVASSSSWISFQILKGHLCESSEQIKNLTRLIRRHFEPYLYTTFVEPIRSKHFLCSDRSLSFNNWVAFDWPFYLSKMECQLHWLNFYSLDIVELLGKDRLYSIKDDVASFEENESGIFIESVKDYNYFTPGHEEQLRFLQDKLDLASVPGYRSRQNLPRE